MLLPARGGALLASAAMLLMVLCAAHLPGLVMEQRVGGWSEYAKVLGPVVGLDAVDVMDVIVRGERTAEDAFHHEAVFQDIALDCGGMVRGVNRHVTGGIDEAPALPLVGRGAALGVAVPSEARCRMAAKVTPWSERDRGDARPVAASAFTQTGWNLVARRLVPMMGASELGVARRGMSLEKPLVSVLVQTMRADGLTASAGAELHSPIFARALALSTLNQEA